jgi:acylphosphatase
MQSRRYSIRGRVQGVWYRATLQQRAREAGFSGYVRNMADGSVEAAVSCPNDDCFDRFEVLLYQGSPLSAVEATSYDVIEEVYEGDFEVR